MIGFPNARKSALWLAAVIALALAACTGTAEPPAGTPAPTSTPKGTSTPEPPRFGKVGETLQQEGWRMTLTKVEQLTPEQAQQANNGVPLSGTLHVFYLTVDRTVGRSNLNLADFQIDTSADQYLKPINCCAPYAVRNGARGVPSSGIPYEVTRTANIALFVQVPAGSTADVLRFIDGKGLNWNLTG